MNNNLLSLQLILYRNNKTPFSTKYSRIRQYLTKVLTLTPKSCIKEMVSEANDLSNENEQYFEGLK